MAADPKRALDLMLRVWRPAVEQVRRNVIEMKQFVDAENGGFVIEPWDYRYYAHKLRKACDGFELNEIKPYLQLDRVREAMF